ncbi:MAG: acyl-CoA dehydrogenase family protein [Pseudomonadota bacterium]|nr:acyl-CoA dehydrogenase family protein [Pseudomonadota bacterium]
MNFSFTPEQTLLRESLAAWLADHYGFEARRAAIASNAGWRPEVWRAFAEDLGILGASFPEALGGLGGDAVDVMVVMEEFGKALVIEPYLATVVIAGGFLTHAAAQDNSGAAAELIGQIVAGHAIFAFAQAEPQGRYNLADLQTTARKDGAGYVLSGHKAVVIGAPFASHLIVTARTGGARREAGGVSVLVVDRAAKGVVTRDYPTVDGGRASEVFFENVALPAQALIGPEGAALPLVEQVVDEAIAALCAEACGVLRRLHEGTLAYTRERRQFGAPIAAFQVLQHRMVDMFIDLEQAVSMTCMAHVKLGLPAPERAKAVSAAKVQVGRACRFVGQSAIQLHGGMGMTDEMAIGHYFKRATLIEGEFGSVDHHLARYEAASFGEGG